MDGRTHLHPADLRGYSRLAIDATLGLADLVESLHHTIARARHPLAKPAAGRTKGVTGLVYRIVRGVTRLVGGSLDALLGQLEKVLARKRSSSGREAVLAALNGVLGDHLAATGNPLAIPMRLRRDGVALDLERAALRSAIAGPRPRVLVLVHGLCMNDLQWNRQGYDLGASLARAGGFTPVYLHYNSGLHVSTNGREFAGLLEALVREWPVPVEEVVIVAHSMGGLVARSACHYARAARHAWRRRLTRIFFLGTPHHGAPLERGGNWVNLVLDSSAYTEPFARLGKIRSAGITDLRHGSLVDEDWKGRDPFAHRAPPRRRPPLPAGVRCYAIAATTGRRVGSLGDRMLGDGLVPVASALGRGPGPGGRALFPESRRWIGAGMNHLDLLGRPEVGERIARWLAGDAPAGAAGPLRL